MSDEPRWTPTEEESEANAARLRGEARLAEAEAEKAEFEAAQALERLSVTKLETRKKLEDDAAHRAKDWFHHIYRFDGAVTAASVEKCIEKLTEWHRLDPECDIEVIFSSPGGSIFDGMELYDFIVELCERGHCVTTGGVGMAASMAGILVQSGSKRYLSRECWLLIHKASLMAMGSSDSIEDTVKFIRRIEKRIIDIFVSRSGGRMTSQRIKRNWLRQDWWLNADECLEFGLIDEIRGLLPEDDGEVE
jgi:ATP-dependent Clp endopeptidase proteolytic subunit ClpP